MKINNIIFPSYNSTDGISADIFLAGCDRKPKCKNCYNPTLWNFDNGKEVNYEELASWLKLKNDLFDNIGILGGEPLSQKDLIILLNNLINIKPIWLYTSYEIEEVPKEIQRCCEYIKTGRYISELNNDNYLSHKIKLASTNQKILKKGVDYCIK
jgi:anaerobic ribonucleoside-triphosphate reductase activating protein